MTRSSKVATSFKTDLPRMQSKPIPIAPGFHVFRYLCEGERDLPKMVLMQLPGAPGSIEIVGPRQGGQVTLSAYGEMAVVYVSGEEETAITLTLYIPRSFPERKVAVEVQKLDGAPVSGQSMGPTASSSTASLVKLSGHVERAGDVTSAPGNWLGSASGTTRIEGFSVNWPGRPFGVDISYGCTVRGMGQSPAVLTGDFAGSRQRAAPIQAVWFKLIGEQASGYDLAIEAAFRRAGIVKGDVGETLRGETSDDFLVGLRLILKEANAERTDTHATDDADWKSLGPGVQTFRRGDLF